MDLQYEIIGCENCRELERERDEARDMARRYFRLYLEELRKAAVSANYAHEHQQRTEHRHSWLADHT